MSGMRRRWAVALAALATVALTAGLAAWQLHRAAQKEALHSSFEARSALAPLAPAALARDAEGLAAQQHRRIALSGRWLPERTIYLDNRQMNGRVGFIVLTPLELASGDAVMVQRGFAPRDFRDRQKLPAAPLPAAAASILATIASPPGKLYAFAAQESGPLRQNLDLAGYSREIGVALRPLSLLQAQEGAAQDGLLRDWPKPAAGIHKHYGYAFQWGALAALTSGLYVWFQFLAPQRARRRDSRA